MPTNVTVTERCDAAAEELLVAADWAEVRQAAADGFQPWHLSVTWVDGPTAADAVGLLEARTAGAWNGEAPAVDRSATFRWHRYEGWVALPVVLWRRRSPERVAEDAIRRHLGIGVGDDELVQLAGGWLARQPPQVQLRADGARRALEIAELL